MLKTVKNLRIGDSVYYLSGSEYTTTHISIINSFKRNLREIIGLSSHNLKNIDISYTQIEDLTKLEGIYTDDVIFLNHDELIIEVKKRLGLELEEKTKEIEKKLVELVEIKERIKAYL